MTKAERIEALESKVVSQKADFEEAKLALELLKGTGPMLDKFFSEMNASDRSYEKVIEFLSTTN